MTLIDPIELKADSDEEPQNDYSFTDDASDNMVNVNHANRSHDEGDHHNDLLVPRRKTRSCVNVEEN
jgi:hypothetical protein